MGLGAAKHHCNTHPACACPASVPPVPPGCTPLAGVARARVCPVAPMSPVLLATGSPSMMLFALTSRYLLSRSAIILGEWRPSRLCSLRFAACTDSPAPCVGPQHSRRGAAAVAEPSKAPAAKPCRPTIHHAYARRGSGIKPEWGNLHDPAASAGALHGACARTVKHAEQVEQAKSTCPPPKKYEAAHWQGYAQ